MDASMLRVFGFIAGPSKSGILYSKTAFKVGKAKMPYADLYTLNITKSEVAPVRSASRSRIRRDRRLNGPVGLVGL